MVERIYEIKNAVLDRIQNDIKDSGIERIDLTEIGKMVDMVKDLAEAEEKCWEAEYYHNVTDAMGSSGYSYSDNARRYSEGTGSYGGNGRNMRRGYYDGYLGRDNMAETVKMAMQGMTPAERDQFREQLRMIME